MNLNIFGRLWLRGASMDQLTRGRAPVLLGRWQTLKAFSNTEVKTFRLMALLLSQMLLVREKNGSWGLSPEIRPTTIPSRGSHWNGLIRRFPCVITFEQH